LAKGGIPPLWQRGVRGDFLEKPGLSKNGMCPYFNEEKGDSPE
jgi:hypothetical protein